MDSKNIFRMTSAIDVPSLKNMMKVETKKEFDIIEADQNKAKKKVREYGVLSPALGKAVAISDIFTKIVQEIKRGMTGTGQPNEEPQAATEEELLRRTRFPFESTLRFI